MQSKHEEELGLPMTPFLIGLDDIKKVANSEKFFIKSIVKPLWLEVDRFLQGALHERLKNIDNNFNTWQQVLEGEITVVDGVIQMIEPTNDGEDDEDIPT
jgi:hypothetical protein